MARLWGSGIDKEPAVDTIVDIEDETITSTSDDAETVEITLMKSDVGAEEDVARAFL